MHISHASAADEAGHTSAQPENTSGLNFQVKDDASSGSSIEYDEETKTVSIPLTALQGIAARRSKLVLFTCNKCGGRSARNVNPVAWDKGLVMGQCQHCAAWHVLSAKNKLIYEEIRFKGDEGAGGESSESSGKQQQ